MDINEAIKLRHSVRAYTPQPLSDEEKSILQSCIADCNAKGHLRLQLVCNEPRAFKCFLARYGKFSSVANYIAMVGPKGDGLDERVGYYGERLALLAQTLGLNTCWVGLSYKKVDGAYTVGSGNKLVCVLAIGHGATQGVQHRCKAASQVSRNMCAGGQPEWFERGVESALLAPTALNQQKFTFTLLSDGRTVRAEAGRGFYTKVDLGIAKYHFEAGAGVSSFDWEQ